MGVFVMKGNISDITVAGLLRLLVMHRFHGTLSLKEEDREASLYVKEGNILGGRYKDSKGSSTSREALAQVLGFEKATYEFKDGVKDREIKEELSVSAESLILEALRHQPASAQAEAALPPDSAVFVQAPMPVGRKVEFQITSDEWNLLIMFDSDKTLNQIRSASGLAKPLFAQKVFALSCAGLLKKLRFNIPNIHKIAEKWMGGVGFSLVDVETRKLATSKVDMTMKELLILLGHIESSAVSLIGAKRTQEMMAEMWETAKR